MTPLDQAHAAMEEAPGDASARLRYFAALADTVLFLLLEREAGDGVVAPQIFDLDEGPVVLAFDGVERLADAAGTVVAYAELPGRVIARQLAGQGVGLGVNLGAEEGAFLLDPEAVEWLARVLEHGPDEIRARPEKFLPPSALPENLLAALDGKLARAAGLARSVLLAGIRYEGGRTGHILAFLGADPAAEGALARVAGEALTFSGIEAGEMDVTFLADDSPAAQAMARVALRIDLPEPEQPAEPVATEPPGSNPEKPPILR
ncbi:MAG: SseB family protein [Pseudorhodobacter sp.]